MALSSQESEALTWLPSGWDGRTSFIVSVTPLVKEYSSTTSQNLIYMKTSQPLKQLSIEDELTSSQGDSPANPSQQQAKERAHKMTATSGLRCLESYERFPQHSSWVRMFVASLIGTDQMENPIWYSTKCALIWKLRATKSHRLFFQLAVKTHPIEETAFGLLPTPQTVNREKTEEQAKERHEKYGGTTRGLYLTDQAALGLLPTPTEDCMNPRDKKYAQGGTPLTLAIHDLLPTPRASDERKHWRTENWKGSDLGSEMNHRLGKRSHLNPHFVEEMMGFPKGWTLSPFLSGEPEA